MQIRCSILNRSTFILPSLLMLVVSCSATDFSGSGSNKKAQIDQQSPSALSQDGNHGDETTISAENCMSEKSSQNFSCENVWENRGGIVDEIVGVKLIMLQEKLAFPAAQEACRSRGGELVSTDSFFTKKIHSCIMDVADKEQSNGWLDKFSPKIYGEISMDSIRRKYGQDVVDRCFDSSDNKKTAVNQLNITGGLYLADSDNQDLVYMENNGSRYSAYQQLLTLCLIKI